MCHEVGERARDGWNFAPRRGCAPRVSVLIPTYNYARFLPEAIESVLMQDFRDLEIIISDDSSRDGSGEVIRHFAALDGRIRPVVQERNLGMVANWNWCLKRARGSYIKFLFGDDRLGDRGAIGCLVSMLEDHPRAILAVSARDIIDERSNITSRWDHLGREGCLDGTEVARRCLIQMSNLIGEPSAVLFRASTSGECFDESYRQIVDLEMWIRLLKQGDLVYTPRPLAQFRRHADQQTEVNRQQRIGELEHVRLYHTYLRDFLFRGSLTSEERTGALDATASTIRMLRENAADLSINPYLPLLVPLLQHSTKMTDVERRHSFQLLRLMRRSWRSLENRDEALPEIKHDLETNFSEAEYVVRWLGYRCLRILRDLTRPLRTQMQRA
jgi:glycosyltransferase involved in cell wall biosynthesis